MNCTASAAVIRRLGDQLIRQPRQAFSELLALFCEAGQSASTPPKAAGALT